MLLELSERRASLEDAFMQMTGHAVDYQTGGHPDEGQDAGTVAQRLPGISGLPGIDGTDNLGGTN